MRVWNEAAGYAGAVCYGKNHLSQVTASNPDAVIVAFGVVDMAPGPDRDGCDPTLDEFAAAMDYILSNLESGLPGVPIYVGAILPTDRVTAATRKQWNARLAQVVGSQGLQLINASSVLSFRTDITDGLHPNDRGHADIAAYWNKAMG